MKRVYFLIQNIALRNLIFAYFIISSANSTAIVLHFKSYSILPIIKFIESCYMCIHVTALCENYLFLNTLNNVRLKQRSICSSIHLNTFLCPYCFPCASFRCSGIPDYHRLFSCATFSLRF